MGRTGLDCVGAGEVLKTCSGGLQPESDLIDNKLGSGYRIQQQVQGAKHSKTAPEYSCGW